MGKLTDLTNVITSLTDNDLIHAVDVSDPTQDPAGSSGKVDILTLKGALGVASNTIVINSEADFPAPIAGVITLESGKDYRMNNVVVTANRFVIPVGGFVRISSNSLSHALVYVGGGVMFTAINFSLFLTNTILLQAPGGTFFDLDGPGSFFPVSTIWQNCVTVGSIRCATSSFFFNQIAGFTNGLSFETGLAPRTQSSISHCSMSLGTNAVTSLLRFEGDLGNIAIQDSRFTTNGANESILDLDQNLADNNTEIVIASIFDVKAGGNVFATDSLEQDYANAKFFGCVGIPDSTSAIKVTLNGNSQLTNITVQGQNEPIATNTSYMIDQDSIERFALQDEVTFNNAINNLATAFNHGLTINDQISLSTYTGTLPPELSTDTTYFVINTSTTTFQLSLTKGGPAVEFTTNGSGILYYLHSTGASRSNRVISTSIEDVKVLITGWVALRNVDATDNAMRAIIMNIDLNGNIVEDQVGSFITADNTKPSSSVLSNSITLSEGEGLTLYIRNDSTGVDDILAEDIIFIISKI